MRRDLVFFLAGLSFGMLGGYFLFRAVVADDNSPVASRPKGVDSSEIGLSREASVGDFDEDEAARLEAEAEKNPDDAASRARLGSLYMDGGRYEEAVAHLERAVALAPRDLHVRNHLALSYLNLGRLEDAVSTYEETLALEPDDPASLLGLGRIRLYVQRDIAGGLRMWERLMAVAPESAEAASVRDELEAMKSAHPGS